VKIDQAHTKLDQVQNTPPVSAEDVTAAQLAVEKAQVAVDQSKADNTGTPAQRDARTKLAEVDLEAAQAQLQAKQAQQTAPPNQWDVRLAQLAADAAENDLSKLQYPNPNDVQVAQAQLDAANAKLALLQRGAAPQEIDDLNSQISALQRDAESAAAALPSADAAFAAADAALQAKTGGPNEFDLRDAENKVKLAQNALDQANVKLGLDQAALNQARTDADNTQQLLQKQVDQAQNVLGQLESNDADARIVAPFDGKITRLNGKPGDNVAAFAPVLTVASADQLLVEAQVTDADQPRLAVGQQATITIDALPGVTLHGTVRDLPSTVVTPNGALTDKTAKLTVDWSAPGASGASLGQLARVQIIVQQKDNALIVPSNAVRTVGQRRFVEYMDGAVKRSRTVQVGISTDADTEIVSGLDEGTVILAGN
jgi:RND family efflux transporter MFP subunit